MEIEEYCPFCGSNDVDVDFDNSSEEYEISYMCERCGKSWSYNGDE
jgi:transposase-like protein